MKKQEINMYGISRLQFADRVLWIILKLQETVRLAIQVIWSNWHSSGN